MSKKLKVDLQPTTQPTGMNGPGTPSTLRLDQFKQWPRRMRDPIKDNGETLAEDLIVRGMLHPIVVDAQYRIICGVQRMAAIRYLHDHRKEDEFDRLFPEGIPVLIKPYDAEVEVITAISDMIAENTMRRRLEHTDVMRLKKVLAEQGFVLRPGKLDKDEKPMMAELMRLLNRSERTIRDLLMDPDVRQQAKKTRKEKRIAPASKPAADPNEMPEDRPAVADAFVARPLVEHATDIQSGNGCRIVSGPTPLVMVAPKTAALPQPVLRSAIVTEPDEATIEDAPTQKPKKAMTPVALAMHTVENMSSNDLETFRGWFNDFYDRKQQEADVED